MVLIVADDARLRWIETQRDLARALGVSVEDWLGALQSAGNRSTGLTAAVIGAAVSQGLGMGVLAELHGPELAQRARALVDPNPPRTQNPVLREAIRRAGELAEGGGLERLKAKREGLSTPRRAPGSLAHSDARPTADAPGEGDA